MNIIEKAESFATAVHEGQVRKYNSLPYIQHPKRVAERVMRIAGACDEMVAAAWLHDVVEDCNVPLGHIRDVFGHAVAVIVGELTNAPKSEHPNLNRAARKPRPGATP